MTYLVYGPRGNYNLFLLAAWGSLEKVVEYLQGEKRKGDPLYTTYEVRVLIPGEEHDPKKNLVVTFERRHWGEWMIFFGTMGQHIYTKDPMAVIKEHCANT